MTGIIPINLSGSLQNPAWSPNGTALSFTRFREGYNKGPSDIYVVDITSGHANPLIEDGAANVSEPGSCWHPRTNKIIYSSDIDGHDEIWMIDPSSGQRRKIGRFPDHMTYEPSWSTDGLEFVCEVHKIDQEGHGMISCQFISMIRTLTAAVDDCRQPNWSPVDDRIIYQKKYNGRWDIILYDFVHNTHANLTIHLPGDKTDATWAPDGMSIIYSGEITGQDKEGLLILTLNTLMPRPILTGPGYFGAPSWSPDGKHIAAETAKGDPDGSSGTKLVIIELQ